MTYYDTVPMSNHDQTPNADIFAKDRKIQHTLCSAKLQRAPLHRFYAYAVLCQLAASISWSWSQKPCQNHSSRASSSLPGPQGWPRQIVQDV